MAKKEGKSSGEEGGGGRGFEKGSRIGNARRMDAGRES